MDILDNEQRKLLESTEKNILEVSTPHIPHGENIYKELEAAEATGVVACIAIEFFIDEDLLVKESKILNKQYNRNIARNSLIALRKYKFKDDLKNKKAVVVMEYTIKK